MRRAMPRPARSSRSSSPTSTGSTALGQALDPESLRSMMARYFARDARGRGAPRGHGREVHRRRGDGRLRPAAACTRTTRCAPCGPPPRCATALARAQRGVRARPGASRSPCAPASTPARCRPATRRRRDRSSSATPVNVAARLEQAAEPGEILIGEDTYRLVRDAVDGGAGRAARAEGQGRAGRARGACSRCVPDAPGWSRRLDSPLVGRDARARRSCEAAFERGRRRAGVPARHGRSGPPASASRAWPPSCSRALGDRRDGAAAAAACPTARASRSGRSPRCCARRPASSDGDSPDEAAAQARRAARRRAPRREPRRRDALAALLGASTPATPGIQETFWAVRKLLEHARPRGGRWSSSSTTSTGASRRSSTSSSTSPSWIHGAPVLLVCLARPELLEVRPGWTTGQPERLAGHARAARPARETDGLIANLLGGAELAAEAAGPDRRGRGGQPAVRRGDAAHAGRRRRAAARATAAGPSPATWPTLAIPPTIHALLAARLDRLEPEERAVIERASVVGRSFWWGAVSELCAAERRPARRDAACSRSCARS